MKKKKSWRRVDLVSKDILEQFLRLSTFQRLRWLDEAREFYLVAVPDRTKRLAERLRREWGL